jgi:hypothetical protein
MHFGDIMREFGLAAFFQSSVHDYHRVPCTF